MTAREFLKTFARQAPLLLTAALLAGCGTTSGSTRLDATGDKISDATGYELAQKPETSAFYLQALKGGLIGRLAGVKLSAGGKTRALEAEYKALESAPNGQGVVWQDDGLKGEVTAAAPYQVGSQNCRQYTHTVTDSSGTPVVARGAACRNASGVWTPLT